MHGEDAERLTPSAGLPQGFFPDGPFAHGLFVEALGLVFVPAPRLRLAGLTVAVAVRSPQVGAEQIHGYREDHHRAVLAGDLANVWESLSCNAVGLSSLSAACLRRWEAWYPPSAAMIFARLSRSLSARLAIARCIC
jgi:hypothetical protein